MGIWRVSVAFTAFFCNVNLVLGATTQRSTCCQQLEKLFPGGNKVAYPNSVVYTAENQYWSPTSQLSPSCIFSPAVTEDVAAAVALFSRRSCKFAIRSGGHMPNAGWNGIDGGILVSLSDLDEVTYDQASGSVKVGAGNRWRNVYSKLDAQGITVMGGRSADVGTGGFLLGAGFSYLSNANGWGADNVIDFEVVLGSGKIVHANKSTNADLFRALKGGSSNFGVVTTFTLTAYAISEINAGTVLYAEKDIPALLKASYNYTVFGANNDVNSHIIPAFVQIGPGPVFPAYTLFYSKPVTPLNEPEVFKPFIAPQIIPVMTTRTNRIGFSSIAEELAAGQPPGSRNRWRDTAILADAQLFQTVYDIWLAETAPYKTTVLGWQSSLALQQVSHTMVLAGVKRGRNILGLDEGPKRTVISVSMDNQWSSSADDAKIDAYQKAVLTKIEQAAKAAGKAEKFRYLNYAYKDEDPLASYGQANVARLQAAKAKYDPTNVFQKLVPGGFKVPN